MTQKTIAKIELLAATLLFIGFVFSIKAILCGSLAAVILGMSAGLVSCLLFDDGDRRYNGLQK